MPSFADVSWFIGIRRHYQQSSYWATVFLSQMETIKSSTWNHEEKRNTKCGYKITRFWSVRLWLHRFWWKRGGRINLTAESRNRKSGLCHNKPLWKKWGLVNIKALLSDFKGTFREKNGESKNRLKSGFACSDRGLFNRTIHGLMARANLFMIFVYSFIQMRTSSNISIVSVSYIK